MIKSGYIKLSNLYLTLHIYVYVHYIHLYSYISMVFTQTWIIQKKNIIDRNS